MRSSTTAYALAAQLLPFVLAVPVAQVVDVVTEVEVVTAYTQVETWVDATVVEAAPVVTSAAPVVTSVAAVEAPASSPTSAAAASSHFGHHNFHSAASFNDGFPSAFSPESVAVVPSSSTPPPVVVPTAAPITAPAAPPISIAVPIISAAPAPPVSTPTPPTTPAAAPAQDYSVTGDSSFAPDTLKASTLNSTNFWRSMFGAPAATWNESLVAHAQNLANTCQFDEDSAGQVIAGGDFSPQYLMDMMGREYKVYDWANPGFGENTGHFTQIVWKDSTSFGCAANKCAETGQTAPKDPAHGWYLVCNYYPVGNMGGEYSQNVGTLEGTLN